MTRFALFTCFVPGLLAGCARQPQADAQPGPERPGVALAAPPALPQPAPRANTPASPEQIPMPHAAPTVFEYPADLGGRAVAKAVVPPTPPLPPTEKFGTAPKPRTVSARLLNPEPTVHTRFRPPPILPARSGEAKPGAPPERVPVELGRGADDVPAKPILPPGPGITRRAPDVNLPPAMPTLGRPVNDRVPLDDPTAEFGNAAIVAPRVKLPLAPAGFLKVPLPDPFELGEQVKPKVPPAVEPGLTPVPVNPQRVK